MLPPEFASPFDPGELVVHATHGVSRYIGTRLLQAADGTDTLYFQLEYAQGDRVFVPVEHVARLSKHQGEDVVVARLIGNQERSPYSRFPKPPTPAPAASAPAALPTPAADRPESVNV